MTSLFHENVSHENVSVKTINWTHAEYVIFYFLRTTKEFCLIEFKDTVLVIS